MQLLQEIERINGTKANFRIQGLGGWIAGLLSGWRNDRAMQRKQMRLVETLALGGRRQLMLVSCGGELFLVGGGVDSVETIVPVKVDGIEDKTCP